MLRVIICLFSLEDLEKEADMAIEQLSVENLSYGKEPYPPTPQHFVEQYLREQHRRQCRPNTLRKSSIAIDSFLTFLRKTGKTHLEEITREDLGAFVEHEQDRGLKASTVKTRLRILNAFLRFLIDDDVIRPEVLSKRMIIKVPDALPRAMYPDDVGQLLCVIKDIRDRAIIVVLLRTGMRIGELFYIPFCDTFNYFL